MKAHHRKQYDALEIFHFVSSTFKCIPLPAAIIIGISIGVYLAAFISGDWPGIMESLHNLAVFSTIVFGGSAFWMLSFERRSELKSLRWLVMMLIVVSLASYIPNIGGIFHTMHWSLISGTVIFIFVLSLKGYKHNN